jgi:hypothetical protein
MAWKKALFLGGAVLLLSACSNATAPSPLVVRDGGTASLLMTPSLPQPRTGETIEDLICSGYYVRTGSDCQNELP